MAGGIRRRIIAAAESQIGWPYVWGGESEAEGGFDCSGLVDYAFARAGRTLPGRPTAEVLWLMSQPIHRNSLRPADLVFLLDRTGYAYHVALYIGHGWVVVAAHHGVPVEFQRLAATPWVAFGRLWQRHVATPVALRQPVHAAPAHPLRSPVHHAQKAHAAQPAVAAPASTAVAMTAGHAPTRAPSHRTSPYATVARDEDLRTPPASGRS
jgi:hypothetical protein